MSTRLERRGRGDPRAAPARAGARRPRGGRGAARAGAAHDPRAHRRAARRGQLPRAGPDRGRERARRRTARCAPSRPRTTCSAPAGSTAGRAWSAARTSRSAAARPRPPACGRACSRRTCACGCACRSCACSRVPAAASTAAAWQRARSAASAAKRRRRGGPHRFASIADAMAAVPVASAALGAVAGLPAARLVASHFALMTRDTAQVLVGGPALVERAIGERVDKEELGGAAVHEKSGVVDDVARDERDVFEQIRRFLSYLPTNVWQARAARGVRRSARPRRGGAARRSCRASAAASTMRASSCASCSTATRSSSSAAATGARRSPRSRASRGQPVGVLANDPRFYAGAMTADAARKLRRFVELCDTFHLPVVAFVDEPGFMIGSRGRAGRRRSASARRRSSRWCRRPCRGRR